MAVVNVRGQYDTGRGIPSRVAMHKGGRTYYGVSGMGAEPYYDEVTNDWVYPDVSPPPPGTPVPGSQYGSYATDLNLYGAVGQPSITASSNAETYKMLSGLLGASLGIVKSFVASRNPPGGGQGYYEIKNRDGSTQMYVQPLGNTGNVLTRTELGGNLTGGVGPGASGNTTLLLMGGAFLMVVMIMMQQRH